MRPLCRNCCTEAQRRATPNEKSSSSSVSKRASLSVQAVAHLDRVLSSTFRDSRVA